MAVSGDQCADALVPSVMMSFAVPFSPLPHPQHQTLSDQNHLCGAPFCSHSADQVRLRDGNGYESSIMHACLAGSSAPDTKHWARHRSAAVAGRPWTASAVCCAPLTCSHRHCLLLPVTLTVLAVISTSSHACTQRSDATHHQQVRV